MGLWKREKPLLENANLFPLAALLAIFETVEDGRVDSARPGPRPSALAFRAVPKSAFLRNCHSCFQKSSCLAKRNN